MGKLCHANTNQKKAILISHLIGFLGLPWWLTVKQPGKEPACH